MEIISGIERRRQWRVEDKLRIVAEAERPGARFADVARRHEVSRSVLWMWRKQVRSGALLVEQHQLVRLRPQQLALSHCLVTRCV
ncbi:transposase [Belnapia sp. T18]|uniref:Transposase n=1 Tax=Belnapia arida TaxID=2804533 RepID=A0ABS1UE11_9PROT|nr:transposase [Belnapia arida]MBL6082390.1 transposase [Belnapia arida]